MNEKAQNIDNLIFDLGGVILEIDLNLIKSGFINLGFEDLASNFELFKQNRIFEKLEKGEIKPQVFRNEIRKACPKPFSDKQFDEVWNSILLDYPKKNIKLLQELKTRYNTFLLSNTNAIHYKYYTNKLNKQFGIESLDLLFNKTYFSHISGKRKPDTEFFKQLLKENELKPERTLFIDDLEENILAAKGLDIQTIHLTNFKLTKALKYL